MYCRVFQSSNSLAISETSQLIGLFDFYATHGVLDSRLKKPFYSSVIQSKRLSHVMQFHSMRSKLYDWWKATEKEKRLFTWFSLTSRKYLIEWLTTLPGEHFGAIGILSVCLLYPPSVLQNHTILLSQVWFGIQVRLRSSLLASLSVSIGTQLQHFYCSYCVQTWQRPTYWHRVNGLYCMQRCDTCI